jgi:hypothetical protein
VVQFPRFFTSMILEGAVNRRRRAPWTFVVAVAFAVAPWSVPRTRAQVQPRPSVLTLKGATILTVSRGTIPNGTIRRGGGGQ